MPAYTWPTTFRELFDRSCEKYRSGDRDFEGYFDEKDLKFLGRLGYRSREFFDWVEDHCDEKGGEPSIETAVLVAAVRRDYLQVVLDNQLAEPTLTSERLPDRGAKLGDYTWLPRILAKARAKLRGELDPNVMYGCGGDRNFLSSVDIHPADFLRAVWAAEDNDEQVLAFVESRAPGNRN